MNSPHNTYHNPFDNKPQQQPLPRNYSDTFNEADYECKDSIELESYARNLRNYLMGLLQQEPFPQFLFDKLEKRLDGIVSILKKRSAASNVSNKDQARARLKALDTALNKAVNIITDSQEEPEKLDEPPLKKRRLPEHVQEVLDSKKALQKQKEKWSFNEDATQDVEEEETPDHLL